MKRPALQKQYRSAEPLSTRNIFLDTQVYRELGHNPANPALITLKEQIDAHRVVLHTTDITLLEVKRQIRERVLAHQRELGKLEKELRRWRIQAPKSAPKLALEFDPEILSSELFVCFRNFLHECRVQMHYALITVDPEVIFTKYFGRKPPFDGENSKEFPDAFVIEALAHWAEQQDHKVHVVTADEAMTRAASAHPNLLPLKTIHDVLTRAAADLGPQAETTAGKLLSQPAFDITLGKLLKAQMKEIAYVYTGDLADGEAYEGEFVAIKGTGDWSVVGLNDQRISLILNVRVQVRVEVEFEDRDNAIYDREEGRWFGGENASTQVEDEVDVEVLADVSRTSGEVIGGKVLTSEIDISGPSGYEY